jgi:hypothetical protein
MFVKTLFSFLLLLAVVGFSAAQDRDAMQDIQIGLQGLQQAAKDPALLAQLIRDMQVRWPQVLIVFARQYNEVQSTKWGASCTPKTQCDVMARFESTPN